MRKILLSFLFILSLSPSGSLASIPQESYPVLEKEVFGGYGPIEHEGWGRKIIIDNFGHVFEAKRSNGYSQWDRRLIAYIPHNIVEQLQNDFQDIEHGTIQFPDLPRCADAASRIYRARKTSGEMVNFVEEVDCLTGTLENFFQAWRLKRILDGLDELSWR